MSENAGQFFQRNATRRWLIAGLLLGLSRPVSDLAAETHRSRFGTLPDGRAVEAVTLTNAEGMSATILTYGAILQSIRVPDRGGKVDDVALGYADLASYLRAPNYFGATVGRYANRIRAGRFVLDGKPYMLAINNHPNALHGGPSGFDKRLWTIDRVADGREQSLTLRYVSADGEEGYPGSLTVTATFTLNGQNELTIDYRATTDKPTIVNMTNHSFFNLAGEGAPTTIYDHFLKVSAQTITPVDRTLIPTGEFRPVAGTPFDFRRPTLIGARIDNTIDPQLALGNGFDHNFVTRRTASGTPRFQARLYDPKSGRILDVLSNQPGIQIYTGNFLNGRVKGPSGQPYDRGHGIALEPQLFPNTPNQPSFGSARLAPGKSYHNIIIYRFSDVKPAKVAR